MSKNAGVPSLSMRNLGIGGKLGGAFSVVIALMLCILMVALFKIGALSRTIENIIEVEWAKAGAAGTIERVTWANANRTGLQLISAPEERSKLRSEIQAAREEFQRASKILSETVRSAQGQEVLNAFEAKRQQYVQSQTRYHQLLDAGEQGQAEQELRSTTFPLLAQLQHDAQQLVRMGKENAQTVGSKAVSDAHSLRYVIVLIGVVAVVFAAGMAVYMTRAITQPIGQAVAVAQSVARGNLDNHIEVRSRDETGRLMQALRDMNGSLTQVVSKVRHGSDAIAMATTEVATGSMDLSSRTEEQATALEQTTAAVQELASTVHHNVENCQQASDLARRASEVAQRGGTVVGQAVSTMDGVNAASRKIADIIGIIDGIAFQTNILALNAAVEAARAGEQGRGFAVVASEVRALAGRSANAAKEIRQLIDESVSAVTAGSSLVNQAGSTMNEVVASVHQVAQIVTEISAASHEQSQSLEQIKNAMLQMDTVTQQNAALVEEAASAAQSLQHQGQALLDAVSSFKLAASQPRLQG